MKYTLLFLLSFASMFCKAQNSVIFCAQTNCPITITAPTDSVLIYGAGTITGSGDTIASYLWKQISGNTVTMVSPSSSQTILRKLAPGVYTFSLTVTTKLGASQTISNDVVTVLPAPAAPRTVVAFTFKLVGTVWTPSFIYSDGSTQ